MNSSFLRTVRLGLKSLTLQKLRAGLAALGIFIGTTTVIWLVAMGEGVSHRAQQQIMELGATNIIVRTKEPNLGGDAQDASSRVKTYGLLRADYRRICTNIPDTVLRRAVPMRELRFELRLGNRTADAKLVGCLEEYRETITYLLDNLDEGNYDLAVQLASLPADIRGFGHVKEEAVGKAEAEKNRLLEAFRQAGRTIASDSVVQYQDAG